MARIVTPRKRRSQTPLPSAGSSRGYHCFYGVLSLPSESGSYYEPVRDKRIERGKGAAHPMSLEGKKDAAHKYAAHKRYKPAFNADKMDEEGGSSDEPEREESKTAARCRRNAKRGTDYKSPDQPWPRSQCSS